MGRAKVPSILFFDEIDSLLSQRGGSAEHEASRRFKSEFLIHLDGLLSDVGDSQGHLLVLATSNSPWGLDEALRRRLEKRIFIPLPDEEARRQMFASHLRDARVCADIDIADLASRTEYYSGSDIHLICRDAAMDPMRRAVDGFSPAQLIHLRNEGRLTPESLTIAMEDFNSALRSIQPSVAAADCDRYMRWAEEFGSTLVEAKVD